MRHYILLFLLCFTLSLSAQTELAVVKVNSQKSFSQKVPAGEYSGITHIAADTFAVVSDKSEGKGFFLMKIQTDDKTGDIVDVQNLGYRGEGNGRFDIEGVAYNPHTSTLFVSHEADNSISELTLEGKLTGRVVAFPDSITKNIRKNISLESLCYDSESRLLWTATEGPLIQDGEPSTATNGKSSVVRLFAFNEKLQQAAWYLYPTDKPSSSEKARLFTLGVSDLAAIGDGKLLVLEREARVTERYLGSSALVKVYVVDTKGVSAGSVLSKKLLLSFTTKLNVLRQDWANYEGMCLLPADENGRRKLLLVADSQSQYRGVLKDWFKSVVLSER